jgi:hypothetical protein
VHTGNPQVAALESFDVEVQRLQRGEELRKRQLPFPVDVEIDLRMRPQVGLLLGRVHRIVRTAHHGHRAWAVRLDRRRVGARQAGVPHVMREAGDCRPLAREDTRQRRRVLENADVDGVAQLLARIGSDITGRQRRVIGRHTHAGVGEISERDECHACLTGTPKRREPINF